ncbi:MAG: 6,7-dimethyl-8-ribityllumazine synthase [Gemmatimonadales bacterium]
MTPTGAPTSSATYRGGDDATGLAFGIVVSRYHEYITQRLLESAQAVLVERGSARVDVAWVPGALEIPLVARQLAATGSYDAVICLGCVIKGETLHFELVAHHAATGVREAAMSTGVPVINGVLALFDPAQAVARIGGKENRGEEAARAGIEMANLRRALRTAFRTGAG